MKLSEGLGRIGENYGNIKAYSQGWVTTHLLVVGLVRVNPSPELKQSGKAVMTCKKAQIKCIETNIYDIEITILS